MTPSVLISGAGVAGSTAAYWLARHGYRVTVVECSAGQRSSGNPVDVRGPAIPVARDMGIGAALRARATHADGMRVLDRAGRTVATLPMQTEEGALEIPRADLAAVLYDAARDGADFRFDDQVTALSSGPGGVDVTFERAAPEHFDLVIGADGVHSAVRRLAFGPESDLVHHLGVWVATLPLGEPADDPRHALMYNEPGRLTSIHPARGDALVAFIFRGPARPGLDHRDTEAHRRIIATAYAGAGWRVPALLSKLPGADVYFDAVSRVQLPVWTRDRITLAGDAASCVSLFGDGSSLAMAGAHTLAAALAAAGSDMAAGLRRYEAEHRVRTDAKVRRAGRAAALVVPKSRLGLAVRNAGARLMGRAEARS
ncbi:FAD-dependent monooxygenase [Dactylosporangium matsuzakiense]|uniref:FAD-dependent monooxygenase n=1 Tax=Dactylosporangium matsuzakiense TaxID=53360 RepID=UPI0021C3BFC1|nr:FAD-dependent monooxygenase [Dactylosporangium matsuzakiense]UWZ41798.1 FAD-dependent monooxygenase [Dactylosporangium matsuzakiense]